MRWILLLQLMTGQPLALLQPDEATCREKLAKVEAGTINVFTLDNGLVLPLAKGLGCISEVEFMARKGGGV
jgi:hypothetical protein